MSSSLPLQADDSSSSSSIALTTLTLRGVLFRCTIRGGHATLAIIPSSDEGDANEDDSSIVMIVVQMGGGRWNKKESVGSSGEQFPILTAHNSHGVRTLLQLICMQFSVLHAFVSPG
eukprot:scaffold28762_cov78-Skeletonema_dohrnii-CCMP3373.AAC.3